MINYAIIGYGQAGKVHAKVLSELRDRVKLIICDSNKGRREEAEREIGCGVLGDYRKLINYNIQAVSLCVPHYLHIPLAEFFLNNQIAVLCEKPIGVSIQEIEKLEKLQKEAKIPLECVLQHRFEPIYVSLKNWIDSGKLGNIISASLLLRWFRINDYYSGLSSWKGKIKLAGGGVLLNQAIHAIDLLHWVVGDISKVYGLCRTINKNIDVEDNALAIVEYKNGAFGTFDCSVSSNPSFGLLINIVGEKGAISIHNGKIVKWASLDEKEVKSINQEAETHDQKTKWNNYFGYGHILQINNFINFLEGKSELRVNINEAKKSVRTILEIMKSSRKNSHENKKYY